MSRPVLWPTRPSWSLGRTAPGLQRWLGRPLRLNSTSSQSVFPSDLVRSPEKYLDSAQLSVNGFVRSVQRFRRVSFVRLGDGRSLQPLQVVMAPEQSKGLTTGTAVAITGAAQASSGEGQKIELHATEIKILGPHDGATFPVQKKYHTPEFLRTIPHLRMRTPQQSLVLQLRSEIIASLTGFFANRRFVQAHTPIITSSDCEGAGEVFTLTQTAQGSTPSSELQSQPTKCKEDTFFKSRKYLTVSSQLHLEAYVQAVGNAWTLSPCFRAERSDTPRHLAEFYMLEAEMGFVETLEDIMELVQAMLCAVGESVLSSHLSSDLLLLADKAHGGEEEGVSGEKVDRRLEGPTSKQLLARWNGLRSTTTWPRIKYVDAISHLQRAALDGKVKFEVEATYESGLAVEHERYLASSLGSAGPDCVVPVFVTDYPRDQKPFYMAPTGAGDASPGRDTVACFDLIVPDLCELVGGSLREHRLEPLVRNMRQKGLLPEGAGDGSGGDEAGMSFSGHPLGWYLDLRRYGSLPHGGFGLGFDRLVGYVSGVSSVRDVVSFPRWVGRCDG